MIVEVAGEVNHKAQCRVCGTVFNRREGNLVFKYFRARRTTKGGTV